SLWRSNDFKDDDSDPDKSITERFGGKLKRDGSELIGTLRNGLHYYYVCNAEGKQLSEVPQNVAQHHGVGDVTVFNGISCQRCHAVQKGVIPFAGVVKRIALAPNNKLV